MAVELAYLTDFPRRQLEEADVAECEAFLDVALPPDFRAFLLAHDGPVPDPAWFPIMETGSPKWLGPLSDFKSVMYSSRDRRSRGNAIESYTGASREGENLPR